MKNVIVLDIGTQFIKALTFGDDRFFIQENYGKDVFDSCQKLIKKILKKSKIKPKEILLGLNYDILKGKAITLCFNREKPHEQIDLIELKNLIQKIEWRALDNIKQEFLRETELKDSEIKLVNAYLIDIKIDGHSNLNPVGAFGENICISVYNTYTSLQKFNDLQKLVVNLNLKLIEIIPNSFALFNYLNLDKSQENNVLIIDVGGKITEVTSIKHNGEAIETRNFHLGGQIFSRVLTDFFGSDRKSGELIKIKYSDGKISAGAKKKMDKLFVSSTLSWLNGIKIIINDFLKNFKFIPEEVFICGGGSKFPLIKTCIKKENNFKIVSIGDEHNFEKISCLALKNFYKFLPDDKNIFTLIFKRVIKLIQN